MEYGNDRKATQTIDSDSAQPISVENRTLDFTDSAVDMNATTPSTFDEDQENEESEEEESSQIGSTAHSLISYAQSLSERVHTLTIQASEDEDSLPGWKKRRLEDALRNLETVLEDGGEFTEDYAVPLRTYHREEKYQDLERDKVSTRGVADSVNETDLLQVHENLAAVVASMRLRQQEQRHLHQLTVHKIEVVVQKCLLQEQEIQDMAEELRNLREENQALGQENDTLRSAVAELESEASKQQVAVSAMTSAVAGLEGWIDDADKSRVESYATPTPRRDSQHRHAVIRGKGRFRGRYYVDHDQAAQALVGSETQDLHDGVKAWIRGFRDVEDACNSPFTRDPKEFYQGPATIDEDDWGDFERPIDIYR